jgi:hypothetical protein
MTTSKEYDTIRHDPFWYIAIRHYTTFVSVHCTVRTFWLSLCSANGSARVVRSFVFLPLKKDSGVRSFLTLLLDLGALLLDVRGAFTLFGGAKLPAPALVSLEVRRGTLLLFAADLPIDKRFVLIGINEFVDSNESPSGQSL